MSRTSRLVRVALKSMLDVHKRKGILYKITRAYYYQSVGVAWLDKPLRFRQEAVAVVTLLGVIGVTIKSWRFVLYSVLFYVIVTAFFMLLGKRVVRSGLAEYETTVNNEQNKELSTIAAEVREVLKEVNEIKECLGAKAREKQRRLDEIRQSGVPVLVGDKAEKAWIYNDELVFEGKEGIYYLDEKTGWKRKDC